MQRAQHSMESTVQKSFCYIRLCFRFVLTETVFETDATLNIEYNVYVSDFPYKRQAGKGIRGSLKAWQA